MEEISYIEPFITDSDVVLESFPVEDYVQEVDQCDAEPEGSLTSKPQAQSKSKFAFPFGAQIATPCTYSVF